MHTRQLPAFAPRILGAPNPFRFFPKMPLLSSSGRPIQTIKGARIFPGMTPIRPKLEIRGFTRDSTGAALGGCVVSLHRVSDNQLIDSTISDGQGNYEFASAGMSTPYYVVAYLLGSPNVAGVTADPLLGA